MEVLLMRPPYVPIPMNPWRNQGDQDPGGLGGPGCLLIDTVETKTSAQFHTKA
jgi:hypothetical protein